MKVVLTGEPGIGKTTLVKKVAGVLKDRALGFWTEEVRDPKSGRRTGFKVVSTEGQSVLFASKTFTSKHLVGSYGVNVQRFEQVALPLLERALREDKVIVVDEVGKMELFSKAFKELLRRLVYDPRKRMLLTIPIRDVDPLVAEIRRLRGAVVLQVDKGNREDLPQDLLSLLDTGLPTGV